jgi:hypothetical protein
MITTTLKANKNITPNLAINPPKLLFSVDVFIVIDGADVGEDEGWPVGEVGDNVGCPVGTDDGCPVGLVGAEVGCPVGDVGEPVDEE